MTIRKRVGLAALLLMATAGAAAPASAAWWGDGRWHPDPRWYNPPPENRYYYGYHYRQPPVVYATPYNYGYYAPPVVYDAGLLDHDQAVVSDSSPPQAKLGEVSPSSATEGS